jgi:uncharacterized membrane protein YvlD (DUF360 family)
MKRLIRNYLFHVFALWILSVVLPGGVTITNNLNSFLIAAAILTLLNLLLKPVLKILFFPINALTLGLFSLVINAIVFLIFIKISPSVQIHSWNFPGLNYMNIIIPNVNLPDYVVIFIASFIVSFVTNIFMYLVDDN